jgi:hypothetical protein
MSPLDIVSEIVSYSAVLQHPCAKEETMHGDAHAENAGRGVERASAIAEGTRQCTRLAGTTTGGAWKNAPGGEQNVCARYGILDAVHNQAQRICIGGPIAVTVIKIVVIDSKADA